MEVKDKIIIGLLVAILVISGVAVFKGKSASVGAYDESFTNLTNLAVSGQAVINNLSEVGTVSAVSTTSSTYTLGVTNVCPVTLLNITPLAASLTVTFPATTTLFASCLKNVGEVQLFNIQSIATSTVVAAGAGGTLGYSSSATIAAGKYANIRVLRDTATTYLLFLNNIPN